MEAPAFPIVGIGASAGGIEALEGFFRGLPERLNAAIVIVTHLNPQRESLLHEVVAHMTRLPVHIATDEAAVRPGAVYIMPPDAILTLEGGRLRVRKPANGRRDRKPIDVFLSTLATDAGEAAVGVILSGGDSDGTLGLKAIKEYGGLTLAQTGAQADNGHGPAHPDMPDSAITAGFVDFAIPAELMGARIAAFADTLSLPEEIAGLSGIDEAPDSAEKMLPEIYAILRNQIGHDFSGYKPKTFLRRVQRRMQVAQLHSIAAYLEQLRQEPRDVVALFRDLLINVTNFFRDGEAFDSLAKEVIPRLFEGRGADDVVRVWVPGCATGEEVFSIGILLREHMERLRAQPRVQIFATDIDDRALAVARAARYPAPLIESVSQARRERFFVADGGSYVVSKDVRDLCIFSPHSVIRDPPFSRIDLVSCRNLLIYFGLDIQGQVIPTFHYALRPNGYLFLGTAENISQFEELFTPIDKRNRIYRRRAEGPAIRLPLALNMARPGNLTDMIPRQPAMGGAALRQTVDAQVLERFSPSHVVVSREGDVVYFSARTGKYLENAPGLPTRQLLTMARRGLRLDLRAVFRETMETGRTAVREAVAVEGDDGRVQMVRLTAEKLIDRGADPLYLVLFEDEGPLLSREEALRTGHAPQDGSANQLERELRETRERLQSIIEEYETALEELKSSNEELVSVNEELQSANEEMEASKEELQSVNEELHTVNAELNAKVEALDRANSDLRNLFESTDIATIFLDRALAIRSFTPAITEIFKILPGDRGRPITDLSSRFELPSFAADVAFALTAGQRLERRVEDSERAAQYLVRLAPYRDGGQRTEGVVITFVDITGLMRMEERQRVLIDELQHRTRNLLAVVQSVALQTIAKGAALDSFTTRLAALARVQGLVSETDLEHIDLREIVQQELAAVAGFEAGLPGPKIGVAGPSVPLRVEQVQTFALALHELATNALKHGALLQDTGRLDIRWHVEQRPRGDFLVLEWHESGVAVPTDKPARIGYGRNLIERSLRFTLRAHTELEFGADGISCRIEMPLSPPNPHYETSH
jgi:two-component system CheB/CheR fusion protein